MKYGLEEPRLELIRKVLTQHVKISKAVLFGSRARGNFQAGSDIDLAVYHDGMDSTELNLLRNELDELNIIQRIDVVDPARLDKPDLVLNINREGIVLYKRESGSSPVNS
jgi:predicted nucleotidyltransferase